ncbi:MAG: lysylphosphatidylglycerol synthase transmembrane domain-containing protein [Eubacteriales bacterium]|nr:lysylphosphatidylglycerol synthase transmembrane domain-containing protein [Eubacteriales bacterium]
MSGNRRNWKKALSMALFVLLMGALIWYVYQNREDMGRLLTLDGSSAALMLFFALCGCVMNCVYHRIILSVFRVPLSLTDWVGVVFTANAMAYVLPLRADLVFSAAYYKKTKGLSYVKSVSMAAGNIVFGVAFALLQMLAALVCTGIIDQVWSPVLWLIWGVGMVCLVAFLVVALVLQDHQPRFVAKYKLVRDVIDGFNALLRSPHMLWQLLLCLIVNNLFQMLLYMVCFHAIGQEVTVYQALFYNSVSWLSTIMNIVPGNIGIKEGVMGMAASLMGSMEGITGVTVSLLQRVAVMIVYIVGGALFAYPVWRKWNLAEKKEEKPHDA